VNQLSNPALKKHALPVVEVLDECRQSMLAIDIRGGGREQIPPLAFKTARALKVSFEQQEHFVHTLIVIQELVLRVDRIESGELTVDQTLKTEL
jgi:hypothetical protein